MSINVRLPNGLPRRIKIKIKETPPEVIEKLDSRVKDLESRLHLNNRNSGKPPSSEGYAKKIRNKSDS